MPSWCDRFGSHMGGEVAELVVAEAKEAGEATKKARTSRQSLQAFSWRLYGND